MIAPSRGMCALAFNRFSSLWSSVALPVQLNSDPRLIYINAALTALIMLKVPAMRHPLTRGSAAGAAAVTIFGGPST